MIFLLQAISGVIGFLMAYTVLKYLKHKALGILTDQWPDDQRQDLHIIAALDR